VAGYITYIHGEKCDDTRDLKWYVGQDHNLRAINASDVVAMQADGDELEHIRSMFPGLTCVYTGRHSVVYWYGDIARTIALNLRIATY